MRSRAVLIAALSVACALTARRSFADAIEVTEAQLHVSTTRYTYNEDGRLTQSVSPDGTTFTYQYYDQSTERPAGSATTYTYDNQNTTTQQTNPVTHTTSYTFDDNGDIVGTTSNHYDDSTNSTSMQSDADGTVRYTYDPNGGSTTNTDPLGNTSRYDYNPNVGVTGVTGGDQHGITTTYTYEPLLNTIHTETDARDGASTDPATTSGAIDLNGRATRYQYDARGAIDSSAGGSVDIKLEDTTPGHTGVLFRYQYNYDAGGVSSYGNGASAPGTTTGSLIGLLMPGDTYRYSYEYDINGGTATSNFDLLLTPVPLPNSATAGAVLLVAFALHRLTRSRRSTNRIA